MADDNNSKPSEDSNGLSVRKRLFAAAYHASRNATQAAIKAGYSEKGAQQTGSRLLKDAAIRAELERLERGEPAAQPERSTTPPPPPIVPPSARQPEPPKPPAQHPYSTFAQLLARPGAPDRPQPETVLTAAEEAFLTEYLRNGGNGTAAWMFSHPGCSPDSAAVSASQALRRPRIAGRLAAERRRMAEKHEMSRDQLLAEFLAIVRADPNELMQMRSVACAECWPGAEPRRGSWVEPNPECEVCAGEGHAVPWFADTRKLSPEGRALFAGVKVTKDGATILTHDKMAALVNIGRILGAFEKDNEQKKPALTEAIAQFVGQLHGEGAGRLKFSGPPVPLHAQKKVQH